MMPAASDALANARQQLRQEAEGAPDQAMDLAAIVTAADGAPVRADRIPLAGRLNFTITYAAHDAFTRGLRRLTNACATGHAGTPETAVTWARFKAQLLIHHRAEDVALWPQLRDAVSAPEAVALLDAMQAEHAGVDPALDAVDVAFATGDRASLAESIGRLSAGLATHMRHEENAALPLLELHLGTAGWAAFTRHLRRTQGLRGGAVFFPWLLDEAPTSTRDRVLHLVPSPGTAAVPAGLGTALPAGPAIPPRPWGRRVTAPRLGCSHPPHCH